MKNRRDFLKVGGLALVSGLMLSGSQSVFGQTDKSRSLFPIPSKSFADAANSLHSASFEPFVNTVFSIAKKSSVSGALRPSGSSGLRLIEVVSKDFSARSGGKNIENFTLIFKAEGKTKLTDQIYTVSHPSLGSFDIFISAFDRNDGEFQAVFNRVFL